VYSSDVVDTQLIDQTGKLGRTYDVIWYD